MNLSAVRIFGFESPEEIIGRRIHYWQRGSHTGEGPGVGVMEDFLFETLHVPAGPW